MCLNNHVNYLEDGHDEYLLLNDQRMRCDDLDNRFSALDSMTEKEFFYNNNFSDIIDIYGFPLQF